jgi:hypothetical protein
VPRPLDGRHRRPHHEVARLLDAVAQAVGGDQLDVGVAAEGRRAAGLAHAAAVLGADQRRGEAGGCGRPAGAGRTGDQPRVRHRRARLPPPDELGVAHGARELLDRLRLADELVPDGRGHAAARSTSTRRRMAAARASTSCPASSTR